VGDRLPEADSALYCSSKAANTVYFNALAEEWKNASVYTLLPDYVDTPMQHHSNDSNKDFDWSATIKPADIAAFTLGLIIGKKKLESGSNIIIVTEKLKDDLKDVEKTLRF
jgi:NAD(P)-dependent dehydrogenase (short-subunit alcohol dehydrogenase family)